MQCFINKKPTIKDKRELSWELVTKWRGELKILFFSLSEKSDLGVCNLLNGQYTPCNTDPKGNITILFPGGKKVQFCSHCPQCIDPVCFQVFGRTSAKKGEQYDEIGWCLLGQGEFLGHLKQILRHTPLELEGKQGPQLEVNLKGGGGELPKVPQEMKQYIKLQQGYRNTLPFPRSDFNYISHPSIALHCGEVPRDLFYLKSYPKKTSDEFLDSLLQVGFLGCSIPKWEDLDVHLYVRTMQHIIFSITHFIQCDILYQPDRIQLQSGRKQCEYFSKGLLRTLKVGDCEDLAWFCSMLLESIQDRPLCDKYPLLDLATKCLDAYIIANCLVQGTAPEFRKSRQNVHMLQSEFTSKEDEQLLWNKMDVFHMTCFLYPKSEFKECVERTGEKCVVEYKYLTKIPPSLPRLYAEATACVGELPEEKVLSPQEELLCTEDCICLPVGKESPNSTLIYGAEIDIITNYFIKHNLEPKCLTFICALRVNDELIVAPEECHWGTGKYHFIPTLPFPHSLSAGRYHLDIPLPLETKPPGFLKDLRGLRGELKGTFFSQRFKTIFSKQGIKSPFGDYWYVFRY